VVPIFFIAISPDKEPLQSLLPVQVAVTSTAHGSVCARMKAGMGRPTAIRQNKPVVIIPNGINVFLAFI
jgi:hypothetical protein